MTAFVQLDLFLDTYVDVDVPITILLGGSVFAGLVPASGSGVSSGAFVFRQTSSDPTPLLTVPMASAGYGVAPPAPIGAACASLQQIEQAYGGPAVVQTGAPQVLVATVASTAALAAMSTAGLNAGDIAFVSSGKGSYFAWSPGDPNTPSASVIASTSSAGNWLLWPTIRLQIPAASMAPFVGIAQGVWDFIVPWGNGTSSKILEGSWFAEQSIGGH